MKVEIVEGKDSSKTVVLVALNDTDRRLIAGLSDGMAVIDGDEYDTVVLYLGDG